MLQIGIREPGSAITHFIAMMMAIFATSPLLVKAALNGNHTTILAMAVFMGSMVLLYGASTVYHSLVARDKILKIFRKLDHMMIFVLIAGSYTPVCLIVLGGKSGYTLLAAVWGIAAAGMLIKVLWINCPKWFSSVIYIAMGWVCLFVFRELLATLSQAAFLWLLAGGLIYTVGRCDLRIKTAGVQREAQSVSAPMKYFICLSWAGSICHFVFMYQYVA